MTVVELRPLSLGELLDRAFSLYRRHLWLLVGIMGFPALVWYGFALILGPQNPLEAFLGPTRPAGRGPVVVSEGRDLGSFMAIYYGYLILYLASYAAAMAAAAFAVSDVELGRSPTIAGSYRQAARRIGGLLDLAFSIGLRVVGSFFLGSFFAGITAAILPSQWESNVVLIVAVALVVIGFGLGLGLVLLLGYAVALPAMLLENISARQAMKRSWAFTKGQRGRVFLIVVLATVVSYVAAVVIQGPFWMAMLYGPQEGPSAEVLGHLAWVAGVVAQALSGPLLAIGLVLVYFDLRVRKEGLDLKLMMESLEPAAAPAPPSGVPVS